MELDDFYTGDDFEAIIQNLKDELRRSVRKDIQVELQLLREENARLQTIKNNWEKEVRSLESVYCAKVRDTEAAISDAKKMRISELLEEINSVAYGIDWEYIGMPKCDRCDSSRRRKYKTPLGRDAYEACICSEQYRLFHYKRSPILCVQYDMRYERDRRVRVEYLLHEGGDRFSSRTTSSGFCDDQNFEDISVYSAIFKSESKARLYVEWMNRKEKQEYEQRIRKLNGNV